MIVIKMINLMLAPSVELTQRGIASILPAPRSCAYIMPLAAYNRQSQMTPQAMMTIVPMITSPTALRWRKPQTDLRERESRRQR